MPTTARGIEYPASTGHTRLWEHFQDLADSVETALDTSEAWTAWTPTWNTVFTSFGSGGINEGSYGYTGSLLHAEFRCEVGTSPTIAAGTVQLQLPVAAYTGLPSGTAVQTCLGTWYLRDASGVWYYSGAVICDAASGASAIFVGAWNGALPALRISNTVPAAWAVGDHLTANLTYRVN